MFNFKKHGMKKNYVTTAVALLLLAGCSNDIKETDIQFTGDTGAKVSFSAVNLKIFIFYNKIQTILYSTLYFFFLL